MPVFSLASSAKALLMAGVIAITAAGASSYVSAQSAPQSDPNGYAKDQCKDGGWETLGFRNQGQCVSFFVSNAP